MSEEVPRLEVLTVPLELFLVEILSRELFLLELVPTRFVCVLVVPLRELILVPVSIRPFASLVMEDLEPLLLVAFDETTSLLLEELFALVLNLSLVFDRAEEYCGLV